jgi:hypothetical protein
VAQVVQPKQKSDKGINRQQKTQTNINLHKPEFVDLTGRSSNFLVKDLAAVHSIFINYDLSK